MDEYRDKNGLLTDPVGKPIQDKDKGEIYRSFMVRLLEWQRGTTKTPAVPVQATENDLSQKYAAAINGQGSARQERPKDNGNCTGVKNATNIMEKAKRTEGYNPELHIGFHTQVWGDLKKITYAEFSTKDGIVIIRGRVSGDLFGPLYVSGDISYITGKTRKVVCMSGFEKIGQNGIKTRVITSMQLVPEENAREFGTKIFNGGFMCLDEFFLEGVVSGLSGNVSKIWNEASNLRFGIDPTHWIGDVSHAYSIPLLPKAEQDPEAESWFLGRMEEIFKETGEYPAETVIENGNLFLVPTYEELAGTRLYRIPVFLGHSFGDSAIENYMKSLDIPKPESFEIEWIDGCLWYLPEKGDMSKAMLLYDPSENENICEEIWEEQGIDIEASGVEVSIILSTPTRANAKNPPPQIPRLLPPIAEPSSEVEVPRKRHLFSRAKEAIRLY